MTDGNAPRKDDATGPPSGYFLPGVPQVTGFTPEDEESYHSPLGKNHSSGRHTQQPQVPHHEAVAYSHRDAATIPTPPSLPPYSSQVALDDATEQAFSPEDEDVANIISQLRDNPQENPVVVDESWADPDTKAGLGEPYAKRDKQWQAKVIPLRKIGVRELLFGRVVSKGSLVVVLLAALICALIGGYIGRQTGLYQARLTSHYPQLKIDKSAIPEGGIEAIAQSQSPAVVQIIASFENGASFGSGVVVDKQGYVWTNYHVISPVASNPKPDIKIVFKDDTRIDAKIVGKDVLTDVAVLKIEADNLSLVTVGDSDQLKQGQRVVAIGGPYGLAQSVTSGVVSALHRPWSGTKDNPMIDDCIQTDTAINEGNSGGGLFDMNGHLVGITNGQVTDGAPGSIGLNYAISINFFARVATQIEKTGTYQHPWLGVDVSSVVRNHGSGAKIENLHANSPATQAGLRENDVITSLNHKNIDDGPTLNLEQEMLATGTEYPIEFVRGTQHMSATITPVERKDN